MRAQGVSLCHPLWCVLSTAGCQPADTYQESCSHRAGPTAPSNDTAAKSGLHPLITFFTRKEEEYSLKYKHRNRNLTASALAILLYHKADLFFLPLCNVLGLGKAVVTGNDICSYCCWGKMLWAMCGGGHGGGGWRWKGTTHLLASGVMGRDQRNLTEIKNHLIYVRVRNLKLGK